MKLSWKMTGPSSLVTCNKYVGSSLTQPIVKAKKKKNKKKKKKTKSYQYPSMKILQKSNSHYQKGKKLYLWPGVEPDVVGF